MNIWSRRVPLLLCLVVALGCGNSNKKYIPASTVAHRTLAAALDSWKSGSKQPATLAGPPPIQILDELWQSGAALRDYEILIERDANEGPRQFLVRLDLANGTTDQVTYFVFGKDPLWVMRDVDYERASNM